jgi:hypothetical protein
MHPGRPFDRRSQLRQRPAAQLARMRIDDTVAGFSQLMNTLSE